MRCLILIPDGLGVRNFLCGRFMEYLSDRAEVTVGHWLDDEMLSTYRTRLQGRVQWRHLDPYHETRLETLVRNMLFAAHVKTHDTMAMRLYYRWSGPKGHSRSAWLRRLGRTMGSPFRGPRGVARLRALYARLVQRNPLVREVREWLREERPDVVFSSHQRPLNVVPVVQACRESGIPAMSFIFSWDNLSSKEPPYASFDSYAVWSEHMRDETCRFLPFVDADRLFVVGTPQFDGHADPELYVDRDRFCRSVGLDPGRPTICFTGGDATTCPEDPLHLGILAGLIRDGRIRTPVGDSPQIIARPSPVDDGVRFRQTLAQFPEIVWAPPRWRRSHTCADWSRYVPLEEDRAALVNLILHTEVCVNMASTVTLDFAVMGKPTVNLAFDVAARPPHGVPVWDLYYRYDHYRPVVEFGAALFARSPEELALACTRALAEPDVTREGRERLVALQVDRPTGDSFARCAEAILQVAARGKGPSPMTPAAGAAVGVPADPGR